jgi:DNA replication protein DnaC
MAKISNMGHGCKLPSPEEMERLKVKWFNESEGDRNQDDGYDCKICRNKGVIMDLVEEDGSLHRVSRECRCVATRNSIMRMRRSGLKNIITEYTFDKFETGEEWQKTIKDAAVAYAKEPQGWFFIGGQSGCGKTHICTAICREFLLNGKEVIYMLWRDDVVKVKGAVNDHEVYGDLIEKYKKAGVLYIDDLFKTGKGPDGATQRPTGADVNVAFEILNYRYNSKMPTVISSECTIADLLDIDEALGGRIAETAKVFSLKPDRSRNYRLKKAVEM